LSDGRDFERWSARLLGRKRRGDAAEDQACQSVHQPLLKGKIRSQMKGSTIAILVVLFIVIAGARRRRRRQQR